MALTMFEHFHFIRPEWLWGLPLAVFAWLIVKNQRGDQQWSSHIPKAMLAALQIGKSTQSNGWKWSLLVLWLGVIIAAAGPTWDQQASPTVQNQKAVVLVLDLSPSMLAKDLTPDRLSRAKFKLIDVLRQQADGQVALIAYAGDAHTVSPLTDDPRTIQSLLPALHPNVMPSNGSNTEAAIELAQKLLRDAGLTSGDILLITDGVNNDAIETITDSIDSNYRVSILAVGGTEAAPIPKSNGGFLRKANGEIILSAVNSRQLRTMATGLGGRFSMLSADDVDIQTLRIGEYEMADMADQALQSSVVYDAWVDRGHWLVLLILPLALMLFRKGVIYSLPLCIPILFLSPTDSYAQNNGQVSADTVAGRSDVSEPGWQSAWENLWQTPDQRASKQFSEGDFESAAATFKRKDWSALANYNNGDYQKTIDQLSDIEDPTSLYNKANALAFNQQLQESVDAYQQVLTQQPDHQDAKHNKSIVEQLLKDQEEQEQQQDSDGTSDEDSQQNQPQDDESQPSDNESQPSDNESQPSDNESQPSDNESQPSDNESQASDDESQGEPSQEQPPEAGNDADQQDSEQNSDQQQEDEQQSEASTEDDSQDQQASESAAAGAQIEESDDPLQDSSEQWLRTIEDDPSGLLRRKFEYQAGQRAQQARPQSNDKAAQQRY
ncbi:MAG: Ca-activated chloride channel family protein [Arenicella sp.]|jgi:Ca-activated chloride channel family protein